MKSQWLITVLCAVWSTKTWWKWRYRKLQTQTAMQSGWQRVVWVGHNHKHFRWSGNKRVLVDLPKGGTWHAQKHPTLPRGQVGLRKGVIGLQPLSQTNLPSSYQPAVHPSSSSSPDDNDATLGFSLPPLSQWHHKEAWNSDVKGVVSRRWQHIKSLWVKR